MKQTTAGVAGLPNNFRLENYDVCSRWGAREWWQALTWRSLAHLFLNRPAESYTDSEQEAAEAVEMWKDWVLGLFNDPLPDLDDEDRIYPPNGWQSPIRDLTGSDFYEGLYKVNDESYNASAVLAKKVARGTGVLNAGDPEQQQIEIEALRATAALDRLPAWRLRREANSFGADKFHIEVDLATSDEDLLREFKRWLKRTRADADVPKIPRRLGPNDFADWHAKRLLPCLDLALWAQATGSSLTLAVLGHALFPDESGREHIRDLEPMIRRTIQPQARMLARWELVKMLYKQMNEES